MLTDLGMQSQRVCQVGNSRPGRSLAMSMVYGPLKPGRLVFIPNSPKRSL